jgi:hypothetical protein
MLDELEHIQGASGAGRGRIDHRGIRQASRALGVIMNAPHELALSAVKGSAQMVGQHFVSNATRRDGQQFVSKATRSSQALQRADRVAKRAPQVVVKITSRIHGAASTLGAFTYVGRVGMKDKEPVDLLTSEKDILTDATDMMKLAREWQTWELSDDARRKGATAIAMVFSMPPGTDPHKVHQAVIALAETDMANRRWVLALHTDEAHPHVHLIIAGRDNDGRRFNPNREFLQNARERFAQLLRDRGIDADATMRVTRGYPPKHEATPVVKIRERGERPNADNVKTEAVRGDTERGRAHLSDREKGRTITATNFAQVQGVYTRAIAELEAHGGVDELERAKSLRAFVDKMPVPRDARAEILEQLRKNTGQPKGSETELAVERLKPTTDAQDADKKSSALASLADAEERLKSSLTALRKDKGEPPIDGTPPAQNIDEALARFLKPQDRDRDKDRDKDRDGPNR